MKFGAMFANTLHGATPDGAAALGRIAEENGFESIWTVEHVVVPADYASEYPYAPNGRMPGTEDAPIPDPLVWLTWVGAHTRTLRLATGILILPQRNPVVLAKEVATLDLFTGGRVTLGVGVGWLAEEFEALGVPFAHRGARTREYVQVMRKLWSQRSTSHDGRFARFTGVTSFPKPANGRSIPVWFGGESDAALRRVAAYGDGWIGFKVSPADAGPKIRRIEGLLRECGRQRSDVTLAVSPYADPIVPDDLKRYRDAGVEELALLLRGRPKSAADIVAGLEALARDFVEPAAKL